MACSILYLCRGMPCWSGVSCIAPAIANADSRVVSWQILTAHMNGPCFGALADTLGCPRNLICASVHASKRRAASCTAGWLEISAPVAPAAAATCRATTPSMKRNVFIRITHLQHAAIRGLRRGAAGRESYPGSGSPAEGVVGLPRTHWDPDDGKETGNDLTA